MDRGARLGAPWLQCDPCKYHARCSISADCIVSTPRRSWTKGNMLTLEESCASPKPDLTDMDLSLYLKSYLKSMLENVIDVARGKGA